jgi:hypothetical protein
VGGSRNQSGHLNASHIRKKLEVKLNDGLLEFKISKKNFRGGAQGSNLYAQVRNVVQNSAPLTLYIAKTTLQSMIKHKSTRYHSSLKRKYMFAFVVHVFLLYVFYNKLKGRCYLDLWLRALCN